MKEKLAKCVTSGDSHAVIKDTPSDELKEFHKALTGAKKFIDLTMRDEFILSQVSFELGYR